MHNTYTTPKLASFPGSLPEWWQRKVPGNEATPKTTHSFNISHWEQVVVYSFIKISKLAVTPTELKPDITMHHSRPITVEERLCQICPCGTVQNFLVPIYIYIYIYIYMIIMIWYVFLSRATGAQANSDLYDWVHVYI